MEADIENLKFNTAISALMVFNNAALKKGKVTGKRLKLSQRYSPFAPHLGEELWSILGHENSLAYLPWPEVDEKLLTEESFEYPVSFNGKMRFRIELPLNMPQPEIEEAVLADPKAQKWIEGKTIRKFILVPQKIINVVVG